MQFSADVGCHCFAINVDKPCCTVDSSGLTTIDKPIIAVVDGLLW